MPAPLLDQYGQPITAKQISAARKREPVAGPTLAGVRQVFSDPVTAGLTPEELASILLEAERGNARRYLDLAEAIEERDLHYASVLGTRKRSVMQLPLTIEAGSDDPNHQKHADFVEEWLKGGMLDAALFDILDAIGKGFSVHEIDWAQGVLPQGAQPARLIHRPARWFDTPMMIGQIIDDPTRLPDGTEVMLRDAGGVRTMNPLKFVVHKHPAKSGLPIRAGLARIATWAWMFKAFTVADWAVFVRNYGQPVRLGKYGPESSDEDRNVLWRAVANIAGDCAAIIPSSMQVEFIEVGDVSKGAEVYERRADWLDKQVSKAVLGQTATTDASPGSHAAGRTHRLVQEDIERSDAKLLAATIATQIVRPMVMLTFGPQDKYPRVHIGRPDEMPPVELAQALGVLVPMGLRVKQEEVRQRLTLSEPDPDDELLGAASGGAVPGKGAAPGRKTAPPPSAEPGEGEEEAEEATAQEADEQAREAAARPPAMLARLAQRQGGGPRELLDAMMERMAQEAQGALAGLTAQVRREIMAAESLPDMLLRLNQLRLDRTAYAEAMRGGLALAHLVGGATALDEQPG